MVCRAQEGVQELVVCGTVTVELKLQASASPARGPCSNILTRPPTCKRSDLVVLIDVNKMSRQARNFAR
jgi:hypothetical protein